MVILAAALFLFFAPSALAGLCPCDCDGDQSVRVHELLTGVNISFDRLEMSHCPPADADGNGSVGINDLVAGVGSALHGCPPHPPPTRTPIANTTAEEVSAARALWQSLGLHHYEYRVRVTCFCRGPLDVVMEVFDDRIVASLDGRTIAQVRDSTYQRGLVGLVSRFHPARFDTLTIDVPRAH